MCKDYVCRYTGQTKDEVRHADPDKAYEKRTAAIARQKKRASKNHKSKSKCKTK